MKKQRKLLLAIGASFMTISACSKIDEADIADANRKIHVEVNEFVASDKNIAKHEDKFNEHFQSLLAEDKELDQLIDKKAPVIQNIAEREAELDIFDEQAMSIQKEAENISKYTGEEISEDLIKDASNQFLNFSENIRSYQEKQHEMLSFQRKYLNKLADNDTDYEDFIEGLNELNSNFQSLQNLKENYNQELSTTQEKIIELNEAIPKTENNENTETVVENEISDNEFSLLTTQTEPILTMPQRLPQQYLYDSAVDIPYPEDGVKGIYSTAYSAGGERMDSLVELINTTDLNAVVIDIKDDAGNITLDLKSDQELVNEMTNEMIDAQELMQLLEENNIYPIARIVVFKDTLLAQSKPEWSFTDGNGQVWENGRRESFVNPYLEEVWDYNIEVAVQAAKLGFKDIQYDYVRFPEGFENRADSLNYTHGNYADDSEDVISMEYRNRAVTEFVRKSKEELLPYDVDLSVDIFGYAAVVRETPGIGQSFPGLAQEVDVISSMIYPSHWGPGNLDISKPDLNPYQAVHNYMAIEQEIFEELGDDAPITRPWLQDFTASYLGTGNYKNYGAAEVSAQIEALADYGVYEFLLWNAKNTYSPGATYKLN